MAGARARDLHARRRCSASTRSPRGYPRLINIICDHALLTGYASGAEDDRRRPHPGMREGTAPAGDRAAKSRRRRGGHAPAAEQPTEPGPTKRSSLEASSVGARPAAHARVHRLHDLPVPHRRSPSAGPGGHRARRRTRASTGKSDGGTAAAATKPTAAPRPGRLRPSRRPWPRAPPGTRAGGRFCGNARTNPFAKGKVILFFPHNSNELTPRGHRPLSTRSPAYLKRQPDSDGRRSAATPMRSGRSPTT
ncbi:MAG: hypothetical protein MZV70_37850 [Desulfobacterales bacterium]|nr:hypothetical protein [Desulfobacterales bacterium]